MKIQEKTLKQIIPIMFTFITMGFIDLIGIASNYLKNDFALTDSLASIFPMSVFLWFLILSIPAGILMDKIGRKKTVLISLLFTILALIFPIIKYSISSMVISFCLIGIGNTIMQVSLNPLLSNIIKPEKLSGMITLGQSIKTITSFLSPIIVSWSAIKFGNWTLIYPIFLFFAIINIMILYKDEIEEEPLKNKPASFKEIYEIIFSKKSTIIICLIGIICHVGIDVGINLTSPKIIMERLSIPLSSSGFIISIYFLFKILGTLCGTYILTRFSSRKFFIFSSLLIAIGMTGLFISHTLFTIYFCIALIGFGNSNIFSIIYTQALIEQPENKNNISAIMIMGVSGGMFFTVIMSIASDIIKSQNGAIAILFCGVLYFFTIIPKIKER